MFSAALAGRRTGSGVRLQRKRRAQMPLKPRGRQGRRSMEYQRKYFGGKKEIAMLVESQLLFFPNGVVFTQTSAWHFGAGWWWCWTDFEFLLVAAFPLPAAASYVCHNCIAQATVYSSLFVSAVNATVERGASKVHYRLYNAPIKKNKTNKQNKQKKKKQT